MDKVQWICWRLTIIRNLFLTFEMSIMHFKVPERFRSSRWEVSVKKVFFKISQHSLENLGVGASFFKKVGGLACNFIKTETPTQVFSCEFSKNFKNTFFMKHLRWLPLKVQMDSSATEIQKRNTANIYLLEDNNRNLRKRCELCSKLTIKTLERRQWRPCGVFIINWNINHIFF